MRKRSLVLWALILSVLFIFPYLKDGLSLEHDTAFHISRIVGLAQSFDDGIFIPRIYPYKNFNFGYASPLFYCDLFLTGPAILYRLGCPITFCYKITVFTATFLSAYVMAKVTDAVFHNKKAAIVSAFLYLFANYHITDVYVRGALGECFALIFTPLMLYGAYEVLWRNPKKWIVLVVAFLGLVLSHNITFFLCVLAFGILILVRLKTLCAEKERLWSVCKATLLTMALSAFFIFPMMEGLIKNDIYVRYVLSDLSHTAMSVLHLFSYKTLFTISSSALPPNENMVINLGFLLPLIALLALRPLCRYKGEHKSFYVTIYVLGWIFMIIPYDFMPWHLLSNVLSFMQFPWRFETLALTMMAFISPGLLFNDLSKKASLFLFAGLLFVGTIGAVYHLYPVYQRNNRIMLSITPYSALRDGQIIDVFSSAWYNRPEVAGADYLPIHSPDWREYPKAIMNLQTGETLSDYNQTGTTFSFSIYESGDYALPITYYYGYHVYRIEGNQLTEMPFTHPNDLITLSNLQPGEYRCIYQDTFIQQSSLYLSLLTLLIVVIGGIKKSLSK